MELNTYTKLYLKAILIFLLIVGVMGAYYVGSKLPRAEVISQSTQSKAYGQTVIIEMVIGIIALVSLLLYARKKKWVLFKWKDKEITIRHFISVSMGIMFLIAMLMFETIFINYAGVFSKNIYTALFYVYLITSLLLIYIYFKKRERHLAYMTTIIIVGYAILLGITLSPLILIVLLSILSVYDFIAVFRLGVMQDLVNISMFDKSPLPMMITSGDMSEMRKRIDYLKEHKEIKICNLCNNMVSPKEQGKNTTYECENCHRKTEFKAENPTKKIVLDKGDDTAPKKKINASALGNGDLIFPAALMVSAFIATPSGALWVALLGGALVGLAADLLVVSRLKRAIPALPLIAVSMGVFWGLFIIIH